MYFDLHQLAPCLKCDICKSATTAIRYASLIYFNFFKITGSESRKTFDRNLAVEYSIPPVNGYSGGARSTSGASPALLYWISLASYVAEDYPVLLLYVVGFEIEVLNVVMHFLTDTGLAFGIRPDRAYQPFVTRNKITNSWDRYAADNPS